MMWRVVLDTPSIRLTIRKDVVLSCEVQCRGVQCRDVQCCGVECGVVSERKN